MKMKTLSPRQIGTLKYLSDYHVSIDDCRALHAITLWSLLHGEYAVTNNSNKLILTKKGEEELRNYTHAKPSFRETEAELTARCRRLLNVVQLRMRKTA